MYLSNGVKYALMPTPLFSHVPHLWVLNYNVQYVCRYVCERQLVDLDGADPQPLWWITLMSVYTQPDSGVACCAPVWMPTQWQLFVLDGVHKTKRSDFHTCYLREGKWREGGRGREREREEECRRERERREERVWVVQCRGHELCGVEVRECILPLLYWMLPLQTFSNPW